MKTILAVLYFAPLCLSQVTLDSTAFSGKATSASFAWSHTTGPTAQVLVVSVAADTGIASSVTYGGQPLTKKIQCVDPQYARHDAEIWVLASPKVGTAQVAVTLTAFYSIAGGVSYTFGNVDPSIVDSTGCVVFPYGQSATTASVPVTTLSNSGYAVSTIAIPNTSNPAQVLSVPGIQDVLYSNYDVVGFSHTANTGNAGLQHYAWAWKNAEPFAASVLVVKSAGPSGIITQPGFAPYMTGPDALKPATCPTSGFIFFVPTDNPVLYWCTPTNPTWLIAKLHNPVIDSWPVGLHDPLHSGRTAELISPPLSIKWTWKNNYQYDNNLSGGIQTHPNLPIAYSNKICFQGGLNANRLICLDQLTGLYQFEADNSGYTESGDLLFRFDNYPAYTSQSDALTFTSTDYTTSVKGADGSMFLNIYNTNGGYPYGGSTSVNGKLYQTYIETDAKAVDYYIYSQPLTLTAQTRIQLFNIPDGGLRLPAVDTDGISYVNFGGYLEAFDPTGTLLWTCCKMAIGNNVDNMSSPAVGNGTIVYYVNTTSQLLGLNKQGVTQWSAAIPGAWNPALWNGTVYVGSSDGNFYALSASLGHTLWKFTTQAPFTYMQFPALSGNLVYVPSADGNIYVLTASAGQLIYTFKGSSPWGPAIISHGMLYASDLSNTFYGFQAAQ